MTESRSRLISHRSGSDGWHPDRLPFDIDPSRSPKKGGAKNNRQFEPGAEHFPRDLLQ